MKALALCALVAGVVVVGFFSCNPNSIGRPCVNPLGSTVNGTQVSSPALECPSRLCLIQPPNAATGTTGGDTDGGPRATCTAACGSNDDCSPETTQFCTTGFVCAVAVDTGPFCCRKICICRDDLIPNFNQDPLDGGTVIPTACTPAGMAALGMMACPNKP